MTLTGKCSWFGGPNDSGVAADEGLALFSLPQDLAALDPEGRALFLAQQPHGTTGAARRLDPQAFYCAMRWDYAATSRAYLRRATVRVTNPRTGQSIAVRPADWGPNAHTIRLIDLSPGALAALGLETDETVNVEEPEV